MAASAPELEVAGRCLIRLECILEAVKSKTECLVVCVCGGVPVCLAGCDGRGFQSLASLLCGCASGQAADPENLCRVRPSFLGFQAVSSRFFTARLGGRPCNYIGPGRCGQFGAEPAGEEPGIEEGSGFPPPLPGGGPCLSLSP